MNKVICFAAFLTLVILNGCTPPKKAILADFLYTKEDKAANIEIVWDTTTMQQLAPMGGYPRLLRLQDKSVAVVYEDYRGNCQFIRSYDEGKTWTNPFEIFSRFTVSGDNGQTQVNISNPEIVQLKNGDILVACNYRPRTPEITPFSIVVKRSTDNAKSWEQEQILYEAEPRFRDGCWEPSFLQLPDGELQVYFANEKPYTNSDEQEISVISSSDNGKTWGAARTVSFRQHRRDGMPVPRIINDEIVVVIEDNNIDQFKPYTVRTKLSENWSAPVLADSPQRHYALSEKVNDSIYMGAPYLLVLPSGQTMISYQSTDGRTSEWELSTMEVAIGDSSAKNFTNRSRPFQVPLDKEAKWNSIALWDDTTVVALASTNFSSRHVAPWMIKGYIIKK